MKKGLFSSLLLFAFLFSTSTLSVFACTEDGKLGIVEENNLYIGPNEKTDNGMTQEKFNQIIDDVVKIYEPIIRARGKTFQVARNWNDGTVNAYAQQIGSVWKVSMFGGLARHETITPDAFALVLCHEIGHHLGGLPKKSGWFGVDWASNEGQADYFGSLKCLRKYMEHDDNQDIVTSLEVPPYAVEICNSNFADASEAALCQRESMAGMSLGNLFRALKNLRTKLAFNTPDRNVVGRTNDDHPAPQCRLDTYFAGSICTVNHYVDVSDSDANQGVCHESGGQDNGLRPLCWFRPSSN